MTEKTLRAVERARSYAKAMDNLKRAAIRWYMTPGLIDDPISDEARERYKKNNQSLWDAAQKIAIADHERKYCHPHAAAQRRRKVK